MALELGDIIIGGMIERQVRVDINGTKTPLTGKIVGIADPLGLLPPVAMRIQSSTALVSKDDEYGLASITFQQFCCVVSLAHIYRARVSKDRKSVTGNFAFHALLSASAFGMGAAEPAMREGAQIIISERARTGGKARVANSGEARDKILIRKEFDAWQAGHKKYMSGADFARKMVARPSSKIASTKTIEHWVTLWIREHKARVSRTIR
jgi:hypothetical protein